jgi:hypothetical protein
MEISGQLHVPAVLPPRKPSVRIVLEAGWAPEPVWLWWRGEKFLATTGTRTLDHPARSKLNSPDNF